MGIGEGLVLFLIIWWLVLFTVLPIGVRSQHEDGEVEDGTEPAAPVKPMMWRKAMITTGIAGGVWLIAFAVITSGAFSIDDLPGFDPRVVDDNG